MLVASETYSKSKRWERGSVLALRNTLLLVPERDVEIKLCAREMAMQSWILRVTLSSQYVTDL